MPTTDRILHIVNFGHALTPAVVDEIVEAAGCEGFSLHEVEFAANLSELLEPQVVAAIDATNIDPGDWPRLNLVVGLPTHAPLTAVVLAELHGRLGHFPAIVRFAPDDGALVRNYRLAEVLNLEAMRSRARTRR
ncbi:MAG: hypothetical protein FD171_860 [Actinobacteria bacterium]|nr:MAG: hypothetical protein FD171_860 [Actinomycetota bacterium]